MEEYEYLNSYKLRSELYFYFICNKTNCYHFIFTFQSSVLSNVLENEGATNLDDSCFSSLPRPESYNFGEIWVAIVEALNKMSSHIRIDC